MLSNLDGILRPLLYVLVLLNVGVTNKYISDGSKVYSF